MNTDEVDLVSCPDKKCENPLNLSLEISCRNMFEHEDVWKRRWLSSTTSHRTHLFQTLPFWCIKAFELENLTYSGTKCATMCNPKPGMSKNGNCSNKNAWEVVSHWRPFTPIFHRQGLAIWDHHQQMSLSGVPPKGLRSLTSNGGHPHKRKDSTSVARRQQKTYALSLFHGRLLKSGVRRQALSN